MTKYYRFVEFIPSKALPALLASVLRRSSFILAVHILTEPFISVLCGLPEDVKKYSSVFLDGEKRALNDYAVDRLIKCGYRRVYYVNSLHAKVIVTSELVILGSANLSERALSNIESVALVKIRPERIPGLARLLEDVRSRAVPAKV